MPSVSKKTPIEQLEDIVCAAGEDRGIVLLDHEGRTHWSEEHQCQVYENECFSPLGDALIALHGALMKQDALLGELERALFVPAAEYVPAIGDALTIIHRIRTGQE